MFQEPIHLGRLGAKDIGGVGSDLSRFERFEHRLVVDKPGPRSVHDHRARCQ